MILTALGASVTQQRFAHDTGEMTGFLEVFTQKHAEGLGISEVRRRVYGGNRASDGGMVLAQQVSWEKHAAICLFECNIEDHNRGVALSEAEALYIYKSILGAGALPVTLLLPTLQSMDARVHPEFELFDRICTRLNIPTIVVDIDDLAEPEPYFRGVHTTPLGAEMFAERIAGQLRALNLTPDGLAARRAEILPFETAVDVKRWSGTKVARVRKMRIETRSDGPRKVRLVQKQLIGPHSPVVSVSVNGEPREDLSVWDPYCHYERQSFVTLFHGEVPADAALEFTVTERDPDYASCNREGVTWHPAAARYMRPVDDIFAISEGPIELVGHVLGAE